MVQMQDGMDFALRGNLIYLALWKFQKESKTLTQSFLSHVDDDAYIGFQLKLDQALVQSRDKNIRYLFEKTIKTFGSENFWGIDHFFVLNSQT